jgi:hypothetical protein
MLYTVRNARLMTEPKNALVCPESLSLQLTSPLLSSSADMSAVQPLPPPPTVPTGKPHYWIVRCWPLANLFVTL